MRSTGLRLGSLRGQGGGKLAFWCGVAAVCAGSLLPAPDEQLPQIPGSDHLHHAAAYFALMAVSYSAYRTPPRERRIAAGLIALGGALELAQHLLPQRELSAVDVGANAAGVAVAVVAARLSSLRTGSLRRVRRQRAANRPAGSPSPSASTGRTGRGRSHGRAFR